MNTSMECPPFDEHFPLLNQFILKLVEAHQTGKVDSWDHLDVRVKSFFTNDAMDAMESKAMGWKKMASYSDGITLTHVTCVFLGMFMLSEFQALSGEQQQIAKWIVLFHDIDKAHIHGKKDTMHAFNSAVVAANTLPTLGFPVTIEYHKLINSWSKYTRQAFLLPDGGQLLKPDNQKLPKILSGIDQLFGKNVPASLIIKTALLHISVNIDQFYVTPAPLTETEIKRFIGPSLLPLIKVMQLSDNEGWSLFEPEIRKQQRRDTIKVYERIQEIVDPVK